MHQVLIPDLDISPQVFGDMLRANLAKMSPTWSIAIAVTLATIYKSDRTYL